MDALINRLRVVPNASIMVWLLIVLVAVPGSGKSEGFTPAINTTCACPNQVLTYTCTVMGGGATLWSGTAFQCPTKNDEIFLRHNNFMDGTSGVCNGGAIIANSVEVDGERFTSQLTVNVSSGLNNRTVRCIVNSNMGTITIGEQTISVISGPYQRVPGDLHLTITDGKQLNFSWTSVDSSCPSISYNIDSTCGACPMTTNTTAVTCPDLQLPSVCTFSIRSVVCGQVGMPSNLLMVTLKVPGAPEVNITPVYSAETGALIRFTAAIRQLASFNITDSVSGSVTSYSISYDNFSTSLMFDRDVSCVEDICGYDFDVTSDLCSSSGDLTVTIIASNRLGRGPPSNSTSIGCANQFVRVEYSAALSAIICRFLNQTDTSVKSCAIMYGPCDQQLVKTAQGKTTLEAPNYIELSVDNAGGRLDCYVVTASSDTFSVVVEARSAQAGRDRTIIIIVVTLVIVLTIILLIVMAIAIVMTFKKISRKDNGSNVPFQETEMQDKKQPESPLLPINSDHFSKPTLQDEKQPEPPLQPIISYHFTTTTLSNTMTLKDFRKDKGLSNNKSVHNVFVEWDNNIIESGLIDVILKNKEDEMLYTGPSARMMVAGHAGVGSENLELLNKCKVFVLFDFDDKVELVSGMEILYQKPDSEYSHTTEFLESRVDEDNVEMCDFVRNNLGISNFQNGHAFYEFTEKEVLWYYRDVVHLPVKEGKKLASGIDLFYQISGAPEDSGEGVQPPKVKDVRVFIQSAPQGSKCLRQGETILYKV